MNKMQTLIDEDGNGYNVKLKIMNIEGENKLVAIWENDYDDVY